MQNKIKQIIAPSIQIDAIYRDVVDNGEIRRPVVCFALCEGNDNSGFIPYVIPMILTKDGSCQPCMSLNLVRFVSQPGGCDTCEIEYKKK